ncbi:MAG: hypothetical protein WDN69_23940 [Aliidongia sp.]
MSDGVQAGVAALNAQRPDEAAAHFLAALRADPRQEQALARPRFGFVAAGQARRRPGPGGLPATRAGRRLPVLPRCRRAAADLSALRPCQGARPARAGGQPLLPAGALYGRLRRAAAGRRGRRLCGFRPVQAGGVRPGGDAADRAGQPVQRRLAPGDADRGPRPMSTRWTTAPRSAPGCRRGISRTAAAGFQRP